MLAFIVAAPILVMLVFGTAFTSQVSGARLIVVNHDDQAGDGSLSSRTTSNLENNNLFSLEFSNNSTSAINSVKSGAADGALVFPTNFTSDVLSKIRAGSFSGNTSATLYLDRSEPAVTEPMWDGVSNAINEALASTGATVPASVSMTAVYGPHDVLPALTEYYVTGIIAFAVFVLATILSLLSFVSERTINTLDRVRATPISEGDITLGYAAAFGLLGVIQSAILFGVGILVFKISASGNLFSAFIAIALLAIVSQAIGMLLSTLARNETQAVQFIPLLVLVGFVLSGVFWPVRAFPNWLQPFSYLVPLTYAADAIRSTLIRGWGLDQIWLDLVALVVFASLFLSVAAWLLKNRSMSA